MHEMQSTNLFEPASVNLLPHEPSHEEMNLQGY